MSQTYKIVSINGAYRCLMTLMSSNLDENLPLVVELAWFWLWDLFIELKSILLFIYG